MNRCLNFAKKPFLLGNLSFLIHFRYSESRIGLAFFTQYFSFKVSKCHAFWHSARKINLERAFKAKSVAFRAIIEKRGLF